MTAQEK
jgi:transposase InsO family protein